MRRVASKSKTQVAPINYVSTSLPGKYSTNRFAIQKSSASDHSNNLGVPNDLHHQVQVFEALPVFQIESGTRAQDAHAEQNFVQHAHLGHASLTLI